MGEIDGWLASYTLNNGVKMPAVGFGTWGGKDDADTLGNAVKSAIHAGYRAVDCAECYGNEKEIGCALKECFDGGAISREDVFITSKVWNTNHSPEHVRAACENTLKALQLEKLDLYLVHWPVAFEHTGIPLKDKVPKGEDGRVKMAMVPLMETWRAMESLVDDGLVGTIGVSNFNSLLLTDLLSYARIKPAVNQVELHPYLRQPGLHSFCQHLGIRLTAYSPLGRPGQHKDGPILLEDSALVTVAEQVGMSTAQVALRWGLQRGHVVIPKAAGAARQRENIEALAAKPLEPAQMEAIDALDRDHHFCNYPWNYGESLYDRSMPN